MDPSSIDALLDKLNIEIINETEDAKAKRSYAAESESSLSKTQNSPHDIDKEITDLENLIKKLQTEINVMAEKTNKESKEYFETNEKDSTPYLLNNNSENSTLDTVKRNFQRLWDDPDSATDNNKNDLDLINETKNNFKNTEFESNNNVHILADYIAKEKQVDNSKLQQIDNEKSTPVNDISNSPVSEKPVSNTSKLGILMRIFSSKNDVKEASDTSRTDTNVKAKNSLDKVTKSKAHIIDSKKVLADKSNNLYSESQQNSHKLHKTANQNSDIPRRLSIININIDSPKSDSNQHHPKRRVVLNVSSNEDNHIKSKISIDWSRNEHNLDVQDCTEAEKEIATKEPCNAKIITSDTMDIPATVKETYNKKTSVIDASVHLKPTQLNGHTKLLDNDLSTGKNANISKPNHANLNEINLHTITSNTKTLLIQGNENNKIGISNSNTNYSNVLTDTLMKSEDVENLSKNSNKDNSVNSEDLTVFAENKSNLNQEDNNDASTDEDTSKTKEARKSNINIITPVLIETEKITSKVIETQNEIPSKEITMIVKPIDTRINKDAIVAPVMIDSRDKSKVNELEANTIVIETEKHNNSENIEEINDKFCENVKIEKGSNEDLTDYESVIDDDDNHSDDSSFNKPRVYINKTVIIINNGDNFSEIFEDSQDHFLDSNTNKF